VLSTKDAYLTLTWLCISERCVHSGDDEHYFFDGQVKALVKFVKKRVDDVVKLVLPSGSSAVKAADDMPLGGDESFEDDDDDPEDGSDSDGMAVDVQEDVEKDEADRLMESSDEDGEGQATQRSVRGRGRGATQRSQSSNYRSFSRVKGAPAMVLAGKIERLKAKENRSLADLLGWARLCLILEPTHAAAKDFIRATRTFAVDAGIGVARLAFETHILLADKEVRSGP
jgi:hypothetical protein